MKWERKHSDKDGCECEVCQNGRAAFDKRQAEIMEEYGWLVHFVGDDPSGMGNAHTHGLVESYTHSDLQIVLPIPAKITHGIFNAFVERIKGGESFTVGQTVDDILGGGFNVMLAEAMECDRTVLRIILPSEDGKLKPNEIGAGDFRRQWDVRTS